MLNNMSGETLMLFLVIMLARSSFDYFLALVQLS